MLDQNDLKWIATASTELNSMLQQISRYSDLARRHKGEYNYIEMLGERVEMASRKAQAIFDRVTANILEGSTRQSAAWKPAHPPFTVVPSSSASASVAPRTETVAAPVPAPAEKSAPSPLPPPIPFEDNSDIQILNPEGERELILFVDDEPEISQMASQMLTEEGYKVILAKDGFEALRIYGRIGKQIGLVILDFFLPVMDGDAVFDELKALNRDINVVLSSGFAEQSKLGAMLAKGLRGFMPKPYTHEKLLAQVGSILEAQRAALV